MISDIEDMMQISIHALREEGDEGDNAKVKQWTDFNPRPPRGGRPALISPSTKGRQGISIHALREEGDRYCTSARRFRSISIHALREEGDSADLKRRQTIREFQSTPSARRATALCELDAALNKISIHALREESDRSRPLEHGRNVVFQSTPSARRATRGAGSWLHLQSNFNPRPPRGERRTALAIRH